MKVIWRYTNNDTRAMLEALGKHSIDESRFRQDVDAKSLNPDAIYLACTMQKDDSVNLSDLKNALDDLEHRALYPDDLSVWINDGGYDSYLYELAEDGISTGYPLIDNIIGGGLRSGLFCIAGDSGLGKTTLAWSMAYNIACAGRTVVYVTLEQSVGDLWSKTVRQNTGKLDPTFRPQCGEHLHVWAAGYDTTVDDVMAYISRFDRPIVFIDYLQVLKPSPARYTSMRESIDATVHTLKDYARDNRTAIIALSSVNRANYGKSASMESIKESGGIEFTADCVIGMYLRVVDEPSVLQADWDAKANKKASAAQAEHNIKMAIQAAYKAEERAIVITCLKTRFGKPYRSCVCRYKPSIDLIEEVSYTN